MDPISWGTIFSAVKTGHTLIDEKKRTALVKYFKLLFRSNRRIVVFGLSGVGKTQFIRSLKKSLAIPERTDLNESTKHELDEFPLIFIDTPGHSERNLPRKQQINNIIKQGVVGIINVVSYGYEENPERKPAEIFDEKGIIDPNFLKLNRKAEIERLAEWLPLLEPDQFKWILTLVNKADLWWEDIDAVSAHYERGDYHEPFKALCQYKIVLTLPYCAIIKPYYDTRTSGKFGDIQKEQAQDKLAQVLLNLLKEQ